MGLQRLKLKESGCLINSKTQESFDLKNGMTIGRSGDATVVINDLQISRIHFTVRIDDGGSVWIEDSSRNGTFVDGLKIIERMKLTKDVKIKMGNTEMTLALPAIHTMAAPSLMDMSQRPKPLKALPKYSETYDDYPAAPLFRRSASVTIDGVILGIICMIPPVLLKMTGLSQGVGALVGFLCNLIIFIAYYHKLLNKSGQTIGKKAMKLMIIRTDGTKGFSVSNIIGREFFKSLFGMISIFTVLFTQKKLAVHDMFVKTRVIDVSRRE